MIAWLGHAPLPVVTAAVFLAVYAGAALVLGVLALVRRLGWVEHVGPLSPGLLAPLGLIFGLLVGFLVADVWSDRDAAAAAVSQEAGALRDVDLLMAAFPDQRPQVQALLRDQIDEYVTVEWPEMSDGRATLVAAPDRLVEAQRVILSVPVQPTASASPRTASRRRSTAPWTPGGPVSCSPDPPSTRYD